MIVHECEQNSPEWLKLRSGIPTASAFKKLVMSDGKKSKQFADYVKELAAAKFAGVDVDGWEGNKYTERGHELEDDARRLYEFERECDAVQVGFVTNDDMTIGCSPDSLIGDSGMLEIKCQIAKEHIKTIMYYKKNGGAPSAYYQQTQGQMLVCEREWCDLFFYHPLLPPLRIRQTVNEEFIGNLVPVMQKSIKERDEIVAMLKEME